MEGWAQKPGAEMTNMPTTWEGWESRLKEERVPGYAWPVKPHGHSRRVPRAWPCTRAVALCDHPPSFSTPSQVILTPHLAPLTPHPHWPPSPLTHTTHSHHSPSPLTTHPHPHHSHTSLTHTTHSHRAHPAPATWSPNCGGCLTRSLGRQRRRPAARTRPTAPTACRTS